MGGTMKQWLVYALMVVLVSTSALAASDPFEFKVTPLNTSIFMSETAHYNLRVLNNGETDDRFQISSLSAKFIVDTQPRPETIIVKAGSFEEFLINLKPKAGNAPGPMQVPVKIKSLVSGGLYEVALPIYIKEDNYTPGVYPPSPSLKVNLPSRIDPREEVKVEITLKNQNPRDLGEVTVILDSDLMKKTYTTTLSGMEEKGTEMIFELDPLQSPGRHVMTAKLIFENKAYAEETKNYDIIAYRDVPEEPKIQKELFKGETTITFTNKGNAKEHIVKQVPSGWLRSIFTTGEPAFTKVHENGETVLQWEFDIQPQETVIIHATENYRVPVLIIVIIVIIILVYFIVRSPVVCDKDALVVSTKEGISDIKVKLFLRNRSGQTIKNIRIIDRIPGIAELVTSDALGTMQPGKVVKDVKKGTIVRFDVHTLDPFEERIVTYKMKSKLKIIGGISLQPAKVKFETGKGTERSVYSNEVNIKKKGF
jgi:hypothetical protein